MLNFIISHEVAYFINCAIIIGKEGGGGGETRGVRGHRGKSRRKRGGARSKI